MAELPIESGVDDIAAAPRKVGRSHLDLILALCAIVISATSLFVSFQNFRTQHQLVAADTWPFIQRNISTGGGTDDITVGISNDGVGPAKIRSIEIFYKGRAVSSARDLLRRCCGYRDFDPPEQLSRRFVISVADNTVQRAGEQNMILRVHPSTTEPMLPARFRAALRDLSFRGCYCSVLDECWISDLAGTSPAPVAACPAPAHVFDPFGR